MNPSENEKLFSINQSFSNRTEDEKSVDLPECDNISACHIYKSEKDSKEMSRKLVLRKRAGELDTSGTISDPKKYFVWEHWILYCLILILAAGFGAGVHDQNDEYENIYKTTQELFSIINHQFRINGRFFWSKIIIQYQPHVFLGVPVEIAIAGMLYEPPVYHQFPETLINKNYDFSQIEHLCSPAQPNGNFFAKYCQYEYSHRMLESSFATLVQQFIEAKINEINSKKVDSNLTLQIIEKSFYMQSLLWKLEDMATEIIEEKLQIMIEKSSEYSAFKLLVFKLTLIWILLIIVIGFYLVCLMKKIHLKETYMITFLKKEMINKKKRVESFLKTLASESK